MNNTLKYKLIAAAVALIGFTSCNSWLDLEPSDTTTDTELFGTGKGYRIALNGIYAQMSDPALYGQELSWGMVEVAAQQYKASQLRGSTGYQYVAYYYRYTDDLYVKPVFQQIWSNMYNNIANCNNLIQRISEEDGSKFAQGEMEQNLIKGEALALRAYLHFDLLRLFAPSMKQNDNKQHLPYVDKYPVTFEAYSDNNAFLEKTIADLKAAKELLRPYETENISYMSTSSRIEGGSGSNAASPVDDDIFFTFRGFRMNYYATCALLARVYNYAGMHKEAFDETEEVINASPYPDYGSYYNCFGFTSSYKINPDYGYDNVMTYDEVIFTLSNTELLENYKPYYSGDKHLYLNGSLSSIFDQASDSRRQLVKEEDYQLISRKHLETGGSCAAYCKNMLPMIRLSEMYYIRAEYYHNIGNDQEAFQQLDVVRGGYGCTTGRLSGSFETELLKEARRAFIGEGQLYFYYKKLDVLPSNMRSSDSFVWPLPDNEAL